MWNSLLPMRYAPLLIYLLRLDSSLIGSIFAQALSLQDQHAGSIGLGVEGISRRNILSGTFATVTAFSDLGNHDSNNFSLRVASAHAVAGYPKPQYSSISFPTNWEPQRQLIGTNLGRSRIFGTELLPLQQPAFGGAQELYYPQFLFGSWNVTSTLRRKIYPFGVEFLPSKSLEEGSPRRRTEQVGDETTYEVHYFSTSPNIISKQPKVIADRAYNAISVSRAYQQLAPVDEVDWDYGSDPTKLTLRFSPGLLAEDMRPLGPRRAEVFFQARKSEEANGDSSNGQRYYCAAERGRTVTLGAGAVIASDTETITEYVINDNSNGDDVSAIQRIAVYLTPNPNSREGVLWQQIGGKAVAFFDYEIKMKRVKESFQSEGDVSQREAEKVCVPTPKDVVQCV